MISKFNRYKKICNSENNELEKLTQIAKELTALNKREAHNDSVDRINVIQKRMGRPLEDK